MLKTKLTLITIAMLCSLFLIGIVNGSNALEIEEVRPDFGNSELKDSGGGVYHSAYARTDTPYYVVQWYVNGVYAGCTPGGYEGDENGPTEASCYFKVGTGSFSGETYTITAVATDQENHDVSLSDRDSYVVTVYKPIWTSDVEGGGDPDVSFVSGYAEISKHKYDRVSGVMSFDYHVSAYHLGGNRQANLETEMKASFFALDIEDRKPPTHGTIEDKPGKRCFSESSSHGTILRKGVQGIEYEGEAYVRLIVRSGGISRDDYHLKNTMDCVHP